MRPLPPTLRENYRYLLVKIVGEFAEIPAQKEIYYAIRDAAVELFGDVGCAQIHIAVVWSEREYSIIRCNRGWEQQTIACTAVITKLCGCTTVFRTIAISGTIHGAKNHVKITTWTSGKLPEYKCSGKKVDSLKNNNMQQYFTRDNIIFKE